MTFSNDDEKKNIGIKIWRDTERKGKCAKCGKKFSYIAAFPKRFCDKCYEELLQSWANSKK